MTVTNPNEFELFCQTYTQIEFSTYSTLSSVGTHSKLGKKAEVKTFKTFVVNLQSFKSKRQTRTCWSFHSLNGANPK